MRKRRIVVFCIFILAFLVSMTACSPWQKKKEPPKFHLVVVESEILKLLNLPLYIAMEEGFFKEQGLEFTLEEVKTNQEALAKVKEGKASAAYLASDKVILEKKKEAGTDLVLLANPFEGLGAYLLAREPMPSFQWSEVKGTIIGHNFDSLSEMTLEHQLRQNKVIPQEDVIIFRNLPYNLLPGTFKSGSGTYLYIFEPVASKMQKEGLGHIVTSLGPKTVKFPVQSYFGQKKYLESHPVASQMFVNGLYKAQLWMEKYPSENIVNSIDSSFEDLDEELLLKIIERYKRDGLWNPKLIPTAEHLDALQEIMVAGGALHEKLPSDDLVYSKFAAKAVQTVRLPTEEEKKTFWDKVKDFFK